MERMKQNVVRIKSYGDTGMRVGDVIAIDLPMIVGTTDKPPEANRFKENYIILNLKHNMYKRDNGEFEHFLIMEVVKPNQYGSPLG